MQQYLIILDKEVFYTNWYDYENNCVSGMIVINNYNGTVTTDGINWVEITEDHL